MDTTVVSFRVHKNIKSWLAYGGSAFESEGELLRLIVTKAAIEQSSDTGASRLLKDVLAKREHIEAGNTRVFAVRLPVQVSQLIRECAARRGKSISEWCSQVLMNWWQYFRGLDERFKGKGAAWLPQHAKEYRASVNKLSAVYSQKMAKLRSDVNQ